LPLLLAWEIAGSRGCPPNSCREKVYRAFKSEKKKKRAQKQSGIVTVPGTGTEGAGWRKNRRLARGNYKDNWKKNAPNRRGTLKRRRTPLHWGRKKKTHPMPSLKKKLHRGESSRPSAPDEKEKKEYWRRRTARNGQMLEEGRGGGMGSYISKRGKKKASERSPLSQPAGKKKGRRSSLHSGRVLKRMRDKERRTPILLKKRFYDYDTKGETPPPCPKGGRGSAS